ncbi:hypothetical protein FOZ63_031305, partial [Perkinsus olseni]
MPPHCGDVTAANLFPNISTAPFNEGSTWGPSEDEGPPSLQGPLLEPELLSGMVVVFELEFTDSGVTDMAAGELLEAPQRCIADRAPLSVESRGAAYVAPPVSRAGVLFRVDKE